MPKPQDVVQFVGVMDIARCLPFSFGRAFELAWEGSIKESVRYFVDGLLNPADLLGEKEVHILVSRLVAVCDRFDSEQGQMEILMSIILASGGAIEGRSALTKLAIEYGVMPKAAEEYVA